MKTAAERGAAVHNALREARKTRYSSAAAASRAVTKATGVIGLGPSTWGAYESGGRKISAKHREAIEAVLGPIPAEATQPADLAAAIREQTRVMGELVAELRLARQGIPEWAAAVVQAQRATEGGLALDVPDAPVTPRQGLGQ